MQITLFNIQETEKFFSIVDKCAEPVMVTAADGRCEDIRNNPLIRRLLVEAGPRGMISQLKLHTETPRDFKNLFRFMLEG